MARRMVYEGSNDRYYGDVDLWERFESGTWAPCCWDEDSGEEWIRTEEDELLYLRPVTRSALPEHVRTERVAAGLRVLSDPAVPEN